jgi:ankyrin repeat protein
MRIFYITVLLICIFHLPLFSYAQDTITAPADTFAGDKDFELILASESGDLARVIEMLQIGANVNAVTADGISGLMYAAQKGHLEVVRVLVLNGANIDYSSFYEAPALISATRANHEDIVEFLLKKGADIGIQDKNGATPLMYASGYGYFVMTDMLMFYGAKMETRDKEGNTALMYAAYGGYWYIDSLLLAKGADVNVTDNYGFTPLMAAVMNGNSTPVKIFLASGAKPEAQNLYDETALSLAVRNKNLEAATLILDSSRVTHKKDLSRRTILKADLPMKDLLQKNGFTPGILPCFNSFILGHGTTVTYNDMMFSFMTGMMDIRYKFTLSLRYATRFWYKRIQTEFDKGIIFQLWAKRSILSLDLTKEFFLGGNIDKGNGLFIGASGIYTYGRYKGTAIRPDYHFLASPQIGYFWKGKVGMASVNYEYANFRETGTSPHRLSINFRILFGIKSDKYINKEMEWL